jgi:hypothetical protein
VVIPTRDREYTSAAILLDEAARAEPADHGFGRRKGVAAIGRGTLGAARCFEALEGVRALNPGTALRLVPFGEVPEGMVRVPPSRRPLMLYRLFRAGDAHIVPAFDLDRYEVTNAQYQVFVDVGGYQNQAFRPLRAAGLGAGADAQRGRGLHAAVESAQTPLFDLLGTPPDRKRHVLFSGSHAFFTDEAHPGNRRRDGVVRTDSRGLGYFGLAASPDGAWLAFAINVGAGEWSLMILPSTGGTPRTIHHATWDVISHAGAMIWTHDGRHLILSGKCGPNGSVQLCTISRDGGALRLVGQNLQEVTTRMLSSDGRRLAFTGATGQTEFWVMRGLLR